MGMLNVGRLFLWLRCVDDLFAPYSDDSVLSLFSIKLNILVNSFKLTVELKRERFLTFMDIMVYRTIYSFEFAFPRNFTHSGQNFRYLSRHEKQVNRSALFSLQLLVHRVPYGGFLKLHIGTVFEVF